MSEQREAGGKVGRLVSGETGERLTAEERWPGRTIHFTFVTDRWKTACGATGDTTNGLRDVTCQDCLASPLMSRSTDVDR